MKPLATALLVIAIYISIYSFRGFLPTFGSYPDRLRWLAGWPSRGYYGFNCSGLIAYAHGNDWTSEREMWNGNHGEFTLIESFSSVNAIDTNDLRAGDIAVFGGKDGVGIHVVAYLGNGKWIDSDSRRGSVDVYEMKSKTSKDPWFQGHVRIFRWNTPMRTRLHLGFYKQEQEED